MKTTLKFIGARIEEKQLADLDYYRKHLAEGFPTRSDVVRSAIAQFLEKVSKQ